MIFITEPRGGLCNQLISITNSIIISNIYNRNLYINQFQKISDGNPYTNLSNITSVINIDNLNNLLSSLKINIKVLSNIDSDILTSAINVGGSNYNNIKHGDNREEYINNIEQVQNISVLNIGNPVNLQIDKSSQELFDIIITKIPFKKIFYDIKNHIKKNLNIHNSSYDCCHLRIENDAIDYFSKFYNKSKYTYNEELLNFYTKNINLTKITYVCTGLNIKYSSDVIENNINFYNNLKSNSKLVDKTNILIDLNKDEKFLSTNEGKEFLKYNFNLNREFSAILDLLISYDSNYFIGLGISSYSRVIRIHFNNTNKKTLIYE